jgi:hypothetical protein
MSMDDYNLKALQHELGDGVAANFMAQQKLQFPVFAVGTEPADKPGSIGTALTGCTNVTSRLVL